MVLMGSEAPLDRYQPMTGFLVALNVKEPAEAERVFNALAKDGTICLPLGETLFAIKLGMLTDRYGTPWMINCEKVS